MVFEAHSCYNCLKDVIAMPKKLSRIEVEKRILEKHKGKVELIGNYVNVKQKATMRCNNCGLTWDSVPYDIYAGHGCPKCANNQKLDTETFKKQIFNIVGEEYTILGNYQSTHTKIEIEHNICGNIFFMTPKNFKCTGQRCPECMKKQIPESNRISLNTAQERLSIARNGEFTIVDEYNGTRSKAVIKHRKCGKAFKAYPTQLIHHKTGCPFCSSSTGEDAVREILKDKGFAFEEQFRIPECKNIRALPFDFCIKEKNGDMLCLIEYQGIQHYEPKFGYDNFKKTQLHDKIKFDFCANNSILLLVIKYKRTTNYNILKNYLEEIISKGIPSQA